MAYRDIVFLLLYTALLFSSDTKFPRGHLEPFGSWADPVGHIAVLNYDHELLQDPVKWFKFSNLNKGVGRPLLIKGLAKTTPAFQKWNNDTYLDQHYGFEPIESPENGLKELRGAPDIEDVNIFSDFLARYNTTDMYLVTDVPDSMQYDLPFPKFLRCGGYWKFLVEANYWMGRGGSKSTVHHDWLDNLNCAVDGYKRFYFFHPNWFKVIEKDKNTPLNKFGWVDKEDDDKVPGYGAYAAIDVDAVDLIKFPGWKHVKWWYADTEPGDCIFIPSKWYHHVRGGNTRIVNFQMWYLRPAKYDETCLQKGLTWGDCTWGFEGEYERGYDFEKDLTKCGKVPDPTTEDFWDKVQEEEKMRKNLRFISKSWLKKKNKFEL